MKNYFQDEEFLCKCGCGGGIKKMDKEFLDMLNQARDIAGIGFILVSAYRCPAHNAAEGSTSTNHTRGQAADIYCDNSINRAKMVFALLDAGFRRLGIGKTFIHADNSKGILGLPDRAVWLY